MTSPSELGDPDARDVLPQYVLPPAEAPAADPGSESSLKRFWRRFRVQRLALVMLGVIVVLIAVALLAPWITPEDPAAQSLSSTLLPPSGTHLLGTDDLGRDFLSRLIAATRVSMYAGFLATAISVGLGLPLGLIAGYQRGWVDAVLGRINDALMAIPTLLLALAIVAVLGFGVTKAMLSIGIATAPRFFRVARGMAIVTREETFIEAARSLGVPPLQILRRHVLPNIMSPLIVQVSLTVGFSILFEAGLSYLGLGVRPPDASWGSLLQKAVTYASTNPLLAVLPGLLILITVLAFNTVGDAVRDSIGREDRRR